jgi:hypothetical protein
MDDHETKHDRRIRVRGRRMWREAGSPKGGEGEYLERARELQAFIEHPGAALLPNPMVAHPQPGATEEPVEEAELLENLGEFPGRTDQGDRMPAPMTKQKARVFLRRG